MGPKTEILTNKLETADRVASKWATNIATIDSVLGRLEVLSSFRDPHTGTYVHHGMSMAVGNHTHEILLNSHKSIFADWQAMSLREQMRDLKAFVAALPFPSNGTRQRVKSNEKRKIVLDTWSQLESYRNFVPLALPRLEREVFVANLTTIIAILKAQLERGSSHEGSVKHETGGPKA